VATRVTALVDPDRFAQAVDNLVGNALRHGSGPVRLTAEQDGDVVRVRVVDGGSGVPSDVAARLFERFATGEAEGGTGLGLFIVRELARAHGGEADYEPPTATNRSGAFVLSVPAGDKSSHL
jgi:signal transduction histidine kinase